MRYGQKYDIFISYRRATGANAARMMQLALTARGYSVFYDYSSLKDGKFNEAIYSAIDSCEVFILMMTEGALDRCVEDGDWVRLEIQRAIHGGKHIVPIRPSDQDWKGFPANLPKELAAICKEQVSKLDMETLFESSLDEIENYRFSKELRARRRQPGVLVACDDYLSSVTHASDVFVGREHALGVLAEMLSERKIPVITGAGGMGKSELVRQYAVHCRDAYPGGRFQVDMETARTWNDVFEKLLASRLGNGQFVRNLLDDRSDEEKSMPLDVGQALLRRARRSGAILLFLDNVESVSSFVGRDGRLTAFTTDFADGVRLDVVMTTRVSDATLRPTGHVAELPLGDLSPAAAQELLLKEWPEAGDSERESAGRVAELLGYRALYLQRVPALIGDVTASVICDSFAELERELQKNLLETVAAGTEEDHRPEVLWNMTRKRLLALKPLGPECVKLAQVASFFSPDGFAQHILKHLWKTVVAPDLDERLFARALEIVKRYNVFLSVDPVRLHRLDRNAVLKTAKIEPALENILGKNLASCALLSKADWICLYEHEGIRSSVPTVLTQNPNFWTALLIARPQLAEHCPWEKLRGKDWGWLLRARPQFADRCPWTKLSGGDWRCLLGVRPQFAKYCMWEKIDAGWWSGLLSEQPQFAERCPWEELTGYDWCRILSVQPQFAERCPWEGLSGANWSFLLGNQPHFAERCPWEMLGGGDWALLLRAQPHFSHLCSWGKFVGRDWASLLQSQPQFSSRCPWEKLKGRHWGRILRVQPQFSSLCPWGMLDGKVWSWLLCAQPQFADRCQWEKLDGGDWVVLLCAQPQFAERCPWEVLKSNDWATLLCAQPQFADRCMWENLDGGDWEWLLCVQPQFAKWRAGYSAEVVKT